VRCRQRRRWQRVASAPHRHRRGEDAAIQAGMRADELLAEGDIDGAATWRAIIRAIEELQRTRRADETVQ